MGDLEAQRAKARRIAENAGEEEESKKREKLQWMYGEKENAEEEYLLGKTVKDDLDFCRQEEKRVEDSFGSLYAQRDSGSTLQVDMGAKLREDPMAYIKKNDDDAWRKIYENPVKMAQLRTILRPMMEKRKRKAQRLKGGVGGGGKAKTTTTTTKKKKKAEKSDDAESSSSSSSGDSEDEKEGGKKKGASSSSSRPYGLLVNDRVAARSSSPSSSSPSASNNDERTFKFIERRKLENEKKKVAERANAGAVKDRGKKAVLTEEEMEERRRQMMEDAKTNYKERSGNLRKYKEEEKREIKEERVSRDKAGHFSDSTQLDFVRPLVDQAYKSAEERIKRNINHVQRSRADQDKNFTKR